MPLLYYSILITVTTSLLAFVSLHSPLFVR